MKFRKKNLDLRLVFGVCMLFALIMLFFDWDLGVNMLTELGGVAITIFVINKIIERRERQRRVAIDQRMLRDIQAIIASYYSIWKHLVWQFTPEAKIATEKDFAAIYKELVTKSYLNQPFEIVTLHHPESWELFFHNRQIRDCFDNYLSTLKKQIQSFINDYRVYVDPELLDILLNLLESQYFIDIFMINDKERETLNSVMMDMGEDPNRLDAYLRPDDTRHINQFDELVRYSKKLRDMIDNFTEVNVEMYNIRKYFLHPRYHFA